MIVRHAGVIGNAVFDDQPFGELIGPKDENRDARDDERVGYVRGSVAGQIDRTILRR